MSSQRFCLRWNNHQSNLLSVFDQLLHAETFTDVTLAIDGQYLKAHKMVLSACSPYFQALFVNHPEKHPIVILKDVPYADMKSLLDFMYRGEVSVDQDRLSAFLRVAESLRIKGLTEVNDDKPSTDSTESSATASTPSRFTMQQQQQRKSQQQQPSQQQPTTPSSGSHSMPKRKRGRPRKLSGSDDVDDYEDDYRENLLQESPELLEVKMGETDMNSDENDSRGGRTDNDENTNRTSTASKRQSEKSTKENNSGSNSTKKDDSANDCLLEPKAEIVDVDENDQDYEPVTRPQIRVSGFATRSSHAQNNIFAAKKKASESKNDIIDDDDDKEMKDEDDDDMDETPTKRKSSSSIGSPSLIGAVKTFRRRIRRKHNSPDDKAEALTEMSVRGLNLFRYASVVDGVYKCTECAKESIQKTFKNKYSFQRHAFLYHEGTQRKVFPCPVCSKEFSRPDKMKNHMKMTHECYMPKEVKLPIPFMIAGASSQSQGNNNNILGLGSSSQSPGNSILNLS